MGALTGKVALITGAGGGIGGAVADALAAQGASIALTDIAAPELAQTNAALAAHGVRTSEYVVDITDVAKVEQLCRNVEQQFGSINIVVNVAGGGPSRLQASSLYTTDATDWQLMIDINMNSTYHVIRSSVPALRRASGGSIVNISSYAGLFMAANFGPAYTTAKAGVLGMTRALAFELAPENIRVNAVLPGPTLTSKLQASLTPTALAEVGRRVPLGRLVKPQEIANAVMFFASDQGSGCTGSHLMVDGGVQIGLSISPETYFASRTRPGIE